MQGGRVTPALLGATAANSLLLVGQLIGAFVFGSVALLADSIHQASDVVSLFLAVGIASLVARPSSPRYSFGFRRADALGGLAHAVLLLAGAIWVIIETVERFREPDGHDLDGVGVIGVALVGLIVNGASARWLDHAHGVHQHDHGDGDARDHSSSDGRSLNIDGAVLHLLADALGSAAVLVGGVLFLVTDDAIYDAIASVVVVVLIVWSALRLGAISLHVLLDGVPEGVDLDEVHALLEADPLVRDAHHLHVRSLDGETVSLTGHVTVDTEDLHVAQIVTDRLTVALGEQGIGHVTLQAECHPCDDADC